MFVERTFTVARPVEAVFDYLGDFTHTEHWDPGTVETKRTGGDGGLGTTYDNTSQFLGRVVDLTYETVVFDRPDKLQFRGTNGKAYGTDTMTFTRAGDGSATEIHYRADFDFGVVVNVFNILVPFYLRPKVERLADETVEQLKQTLLNQAL